MDPEHKTSLDLIRFLLWRTTRQHFSDTDESIYILLYDLCTNRDSYMSEKVKLLSQWIVELQNSYSKNAMQNYKSQSVFVNCIASIFWTLHTECKYLHLENLIPHNVFEACLICISTFNRAEPIKIAFDFLLRSLCYINVDFLKQLLSRINWNLLSELTVDNQYQLRFLFQRPSYLTTIAVASQSPSTIRQLIDSGLPKSLIYALHGTLSKISLSETSTPSVNNEDVPEILDFFSVCCSEGYMRDWLGSSEIVRFWKPILELLCIQNHQLAVLHEPQRLERAAIKFFSRVTALHPNNQNTLSCILIDIMRQSAVANCSKVSKKVVLSDFMRQLFLQIFLSIDTISVSVRGASMFKMTNGVKNLCPTLPSAPETAENKILTITTKFSLPDITNFNTQHLLFTVPLHKEVRNVLQTSLEKFNLLKDAKIEMSAAIHSTISNSFKSSQNLLSYEDISFIDADVQLVHPEYPDLWITDDTTFSQLLSALQAKGYQMTTPCITLEMIPRKSCVENTNDNEFDIIELTKMQKFPSLLQIFCMQGGLTVLEPLLPTEFSDFSYQILISYPFKATISRVPKYTLEIFRKILRLPAFTDLLLLRHKYELETKYLLKFMLGETDDGKGNEIFNLPLAPSLCTLPFVILQELLDSLPLTSNEGTTLRRMIIEIGAMHSVMDTLINHVKNPSEGESYWPEGTVCPNDVVTRMKKNEELIMLLMLTLSSYINPGDKIPSCLFTDEIMSYHEISDDFVELPPLFVTLLEENNLISILSPYLRNDSFLDISQHYNMYCAMFKLLRAMTSSHQFIDLLTMKSGPNSLSAADLTLNIRMCVDTYVKSFRRNEKSSLSDQIEWFLREIEDEELPTLIPDIYDTALLIQKTISKHQPSIPIDNEKCIDHEKCITPNTSIPLEQRYLEVMEELQKFSTYDMIVDGDDCENTKDFRFAVSYHFEKLARDVSHGFHLQKIKRLAHDAAILSTSLPFSYNSSIFVRCDTNRMDIMKVLITGPADTPYANGCFEFDVFFPPDYPNVPMMINLETTGRHTVRFNPNLYNDGKVCLSVLNTWHGRPEEKWNAQTSSFLQVLVSIQSLILVPEPYFNEPGFERSRGTQSGTHSSREYNSNIYQACVRWAMLEQVRNPSPCFKDVIHTHFWLKRHEIFTQIENWIEELPNETSETSIQKETLLKYYRNLRMELAELKKPPGCKDPHIPFESIASTPEFKNSFIVSASTLNEAPSLQQNSCCLDHLPTSSMPLKEGDLNKSPSNTEVQEPTTKKKKRKLECCSS